MSEWFVDQQRADTLPIADRAVQYGDGVFETIAIREHEPRFWPLHAARLQLGCERLGLPAPALPTLAAAVKGALGATSLSTDYATAKLIATAGSGPRGYRRKEASPVRLCVGVFAAAPLDATAYRDGIRVRLCNTRLAVQPQLAGIKSLNRLEQVLARAEWNDAAVIEGLMFDTAGRLICGTMSNVFMVVDDVLVTPGLTRCGVSGVMRQHLLGLLGEAGMACEIRDIAAGELSGAAEIFLTNSQLGAVPVRHVDDAGYKVGECTRRVQALLAAHGVAECAA